MKKIFIVIMLLFTLLFLVGCSSVYQDTISQEENEIQKIEQQKKELQNYAHSHGVTDAIELSSDDFDNEFTIKLQSKYQGKNVVLFSSISDIYQEGGKYYLILDLWTQNSILIL